MKFNAMLLGCSHTHRSKIGLFSFCFTYQNFKSSVGLLPSIKNKLFYNRNELVSSKKLFISYPYFTYRSPIFRKIINLNDKFEVQKEGI
jgi:hypothetical protein